MNRCRPNFASKKNKKYLKNFKITFQKKMFQTLARVKFIDFHPHPQIFYSYLFFSYPVKYEESLNTVIIQEAIRYNKLLVVIQSSLNDLLKALKGLVVMSESLEKMNRSLFSNKVPDMWTTKAYPSLKPLGKPNSLIYNRLIIFFRCLDSRFNIKNQIFESVDR